MVLPDKMLLQILEMRFYHFNPSFGIKILWLIPILLMNFYLGHLYACKRIILICLALFHACILYIYDGIFAPWLSVLMSMAIFLALLDQKFLAVPSWLNFSFLLVALAGLLGIWDFNHLEEKLCLGLALGGFFALLQIFGREIFKKEVLGDGDIIFVIAMGWAFGMAALEAIFLGGILGVGIAVWKSKRTLPMISLMVLGIFVEFFLGFLYV